MISSNDPKLNPDRLLPAPVNKSIPPPAIPPNAPIPPDAPHSKGNERPSSIPAPAPAPVAPAPTPLAAPPIPKALAANGAAKNGAAKPANSVNELKSLGFGRSEIAAIFAPVS